MVFLNRRYEGLYLPISISVVAVTVALVLTSALLSYLGSREMAVSIVPMPKAVLDSPVLQRQEKAFAEAILQWQGNSMAIEQDIRLRWPRLEPVMPCASPRKKRHLSQSAEKTAPARTITS